MRSVLATLIALATVAPGSADPAPPATPDPAPPATCKRVVVGKGLDRHVVCQFEPVIVKVAAPKPEVLIVHQDPRKLVGRPRTGDRFAGLSHELRQ